MTARHLAGARILAQGLVGPPRFTDPAQAARAFGAHQGQDLPGVIASLALRTGGDLAGVLAAFDRGEVVRGYPVRGTVFAVAADSLAWLTQMRDGGALRAALSRGHEPTSHDHLTRPQPHSSPRRRAPRLRPRRGGARLPPARHDLRRRRGLPGLAPPAVRRRSAALRDLPAPRARPRGAPHRPCPG